MILSSHSLLEKKADPDEDDIRRAISGNLCRCTGYQKIIEAVRSAAADRAGETRLADRKGRRTEDIMKHTT